VSNGGLSESHEDIAHVYQRHDWGPRERIGSVPQVPVAVDEGVDAKVFELLAIECHMAVPYLADAFLVMFDVLAPFSAVHTVLFLPLALNEMVLAVWLVAKGFNTPSSALAAQAPGRSV
jgi:hypothetical protein